MLEGKKYNMNESKVIIFIVEGVSDEKSIAGYMSRLLKDKQVKFQIVETDITTANDSNKNNIISQIILEIDKLKSIHKFYYTDILKVIHIVDMDGAYANDDAVKFNSNIRILYLPDKILTYQVENIQQRNHKKAEILDVLQTTSSISDYCIPYETYYFSCNLEHVLHDNQNASDSDKVVLSDSFAERFYGKIDEFVDYICNSAFSVKSTYTDSWNFIKQENNSLQRYTNFNIFIAECQNM